MDGVYSLAGSQFKRDVIIRDKEVFQLRNVYNKKR